MSAPTTKTVLVTDDQRHISELLRLSLEYCDCRVETAASGQEALRRAEAGPVDLFVIDFNMPGLNGLETVRLLKEKPGYARVPVIMLTASGDGKIPDEAEKLGVSLFLTKPFSPTLLQRYVETLLTRED